MEAPPTERLDALRVLPNRTTRAHRLFRPDVVVEAEEVGRVVSLLQGDETVEIGPERAANHSVVVLIQSREVQVSAPVANGSSANMSWL